MNKPDRLHLQYNLRPFLRSLVAAHEAKNGPDLPTSEAPGWQAARELLVGINKALDGDA